MRKVRSLILATLLVIGSVSPTSVHAKPKSMGKCLAVGGGGAALLAIGFATAGLPLTAVAVAGFSANLWFGVPLAIYGVKDACR